MAKPRVLSKADLRIWAAYVQNLQLLPGRQRPAIAPEPVSAPPVVAPAKAVIHAGPVALDTPPPGLDRASWKKFRNQAARPALTLDLHGMTAMRAHRAVSHFVIQAHAEKLRIIEIITGKGEVLHRELPHWLNAPPLRPLILALAHPHAANTGAIRILLRRARP